MTLALNHLHEFPALNHDGTVYADWTGAALPPRTLIEAQSDFMLNNFLGNPHSHHASSARAMQRVDEARLAVLRYFNADPEIYDVVWTSGASAAIGLVRDGFCHPGTDLILTGDNHNSVLGMRERVRRVDYVPFGEFMELEEEVLKSLLTQGTRPLSRLFAYPAKSNFSGVKHSLDWVRVAQENQWTVLLDAAAYVANDRLDLSEVQPDFVPISFYKVFGYPTGIGCLLVKRTSYQWLSKPYFAGGTVRAVTVDARSGGGFHVLHPYGHQRFEDGTVNFGSMHAVTRGLEWLESIGDRAAHAQRLAMSLRSEIRGWHMNNRHVELHSGMDTDIVTFSVWEGDRCLPAERIEQSANEAGIHIRGGCFCNPGANEQALDYTFAPGLRGTYGSEIDMATLRKYADKNPIGAVRVSFGYANDAADVRRIIDWLDNFMNDRP